MLEDLRKLQIASDNLTSIFRGCHKKTMLGNITNSDGSATVVLKTWYGSDRKEAKFVYVGKDVTAMISLENRVALPALVVSNYKDLETKRKQLKIIKWLGKDE